MGDKQRSMEAELEEEKEVKIVLRCPPIYPLPEEIKKMAHSETVCRYCGVSYLIYHEFHQLHTRLSQLEAELQEVRDTAQREKVRREALELGRLEWERAAHLEAQRRAEEREQRAREELEERNKEAESALRAELEQKNERHRREMKEECQKISQERERQVRRELADLEEERLRQQREELERGAEQREKVLSDALQKANKKLDGLRKYLQQLQERLDMTACGKEEAQRFLGEEKRRGEILRGVCARQHQALGETLSALRSSSSELTDVRGFLSQLMGAWQVFRAQLLQHSAQVFSAVRDELKHSSVGFQRMREEKEHLALQLMEKKRQQEEQLCQQREHRGKLLRLKGELEEKHERWLSCQQRCGTLQEQLSSWRQKEEQMNRKCCAAEEEVARLRETLEKVQQDTKDLRRERETLKQSHATTLTKMEEDSRRQTTTKLAAALEEQRTQNALHLRKQMEELRKDVELELVIDREKNQLLLLQRQREDEQLQQKLQETERELQEERRMREEEMQQELRRSQQQEALQRRRAAAELQLMAQRNGELQEEVALLQETVRRECEEREGLTAALSQTQEELRGLRSPPPRRCPSRSPPTHMERRSTQGNQPLHSQARLPLTRSSHSPNTLRPSPASADKDRSCGTDGGGAGRSLDSWNCGGVSGGGTLPRLKVSGAGEVRQKVGWMMERKERKERP